mmetsp:Transcript_819/g.1000  ORF Transcript_819/g.1000 Transcript_819/m.1000 type:complete len:154 (-) Transcript_819:47-508(-)
MGSAFSKTVQGKVEEVKDFQFRQAAVQREVMMAVNLANMRDRVQWGACLYSGLLFGAAASLVKTGKVPAVIRPPLVVGGFALAFFTDFAYGSKLQRVTREAEHILEHERERLVPPNQVPFYKFYEEEAASQDKSIERVGRQWPSFIRSYFETD